MLGLSYRNVEKFLRMMDLQGSKSSIERDVAAAGQEAKTLHLWKANQLLQHIEQRWDHVGSDGGDRTNNATERIIGLYYKIRIKTTLGLKNDDKVLVHCYLSGYLRGCDGVCDLRKVV